MGITNKTTKQHRHTLSLVYLPFSLSFFHYYNKTTMPNLAGTTCDDACIVEYQKVKKGQLKFLLFKIDNGKIVLDDAQGDAANKTRGQPVTPEFFEKFLNLLPDGECRYAVYNCKFNLSGGGYGDSVRDKIVFISWVGEGAKVRQKMLHASSKSALKAALNDSFIEFNLYA